MMHVQGEHGLGIAHGEDENGVLPSLHRYDFPTRKEKSISSQSVCMLPLLLAIL